MRRASVIMTFFVSALLACAASRTWEPVEDMPTQRTEQVDNAAYTVTDGHVYVGLRQRTTVTLFTILGQPVIQATLHAGNYRFRIPSRGIYLLKIGDITRRITL